VSASFSAIQAFRYTTDLDGRRLSLSSLRWEGNDLVLSRPILRGKPSLISEVDGVVGNFRVRLHDKPPNSKGTLVAAEWDIAFVRVKDMGFVALAGADNAPVYEAVRLVDATVVAIPVLSADGMDAVRKARAAGEGSTAA
jgi:hypothetical protein